LVDGKEGKEKIHHEKKFSFSFWPGETARNILPAWYEVKVIDSFDSSRPADELFSCCIFLIR